MKAIVIPAIIVSCFTLSAKAQSVAQKPEDVFKTHPLTQMDSLTWHMPKTADALKQLLAGKLQRNLTPADLKDAFAARNNALAVYSTMPVKRLGGSYKTPNLQLVSPDSKMNKKVIVVNPLAEPANP